MPDSPTLPQGSDASLRPISLPGSNGFVSLPVDFQRCFPEPTATAIEALRVGDDYPDPSRPDRVAAWHETVWDEIHGRLVCLLRLSQIDLASHSPEDRKEILASARSIARAVEDFLHGYQRIYGREARRAFCSLCLSGYGPAIEITDEGRVPVRLQSTGDLFGQAVVADA